MNQTDLKEFEKSAQQAANLMKMMGHKERLMILCMLIEGELCVYQINGRIPLSQSALSQHLATLRKNDLVETRRDSQTIYYRIKGYEASRIIGALKEIYCPQKGEEL